MSATVATLTVPAFSRRLLLAGALLASAIVLANDDARLEILPGDEERLSDQIYNSARNWRETPAAELDWRAPEPEERSRIKLGYDSTYEELRARDDAAYSQQRFNFGEPEPNTLFRIQF